MSLVAAVPLALLDLPRRTGDPDDRARSAAAGLDHRLVPFAAPGLGARALAHLARASALAATASLTGLALLLAGGPPGAMALALLASGAGRRLDVDDAAGLLASALGLPAAPGSAVERPDVDPLAVAALAAVVDPAVLAAVARTHPHLIGPVDGMPIPLRYAANRAIALASGDEDVRRLGAPGRQLLYVDPERGHVAEVLGDLLHADHVAVVVPGMASTLAGFNPVPRSAAALRRTAAGLDPPEDVATIAWLGYDSPLVDVVLDDAAAAGAPHLVRFVDGLGAGGVAATTTRTVVGNSYGSVVAGFALRDGLAVDAVVLTGSPGTGARTADELGDTPIYALRAPGDYVGWTEAFGTDPSDADFGATRLDTGDAVGHTGYYEEGSGSLLGIALVAAGQAGAATVVEPSRLERAAGLVEMLHIQRLDMAIDLSQRTADVVFDGAAFEVANRGLDLAQRVLSPDLQGDVIEDAVRWLTD